MQPQEAAKNEDLTQSEDLGDVKLNGDHQEGEAAREDHWRVLS